MGIICTGVQQLARDQEQFQEIIQEFFSAQKAMVAQMEELNLMWKGPSKDAFMKQFQSDCLSMDALKKELEAIKEAMAYAKVEYRKCDSNISSLVSSLKI